MSARDSQYDRGPGMSDDLVLLAERLQERRPVPSSAFRGELRRRLLALRRHRHPRPERLRALIGAYASSGVLLLLVGALSTAGVGPLAA